MTVFELSAHPHKASPELIADDEAHFAAITHTLSEQINDLTARRDRLRRELTGLIDSAEPETGQAAVERDLEVRRLTARLGALQRFGADLCLGRIVTPQATTYVGRLGLSDPSGGQLLIDWRTPAAEPFFGATHADPMGLTSRRRYRWVGGRVRDYWDEAFTDEALAEGRALDDQSAFLASLGSSRSPQMRDVLGTIAADQDAIIRAGSRGALVVDGGPGTGKTVVALHRTAYLLYGEPRLKRGGVLFVGPHEPYLAYVADVLPSLGEDSVLTCTLRDLVPDLVPGTPLVPEPDPEVARLKADARIVSAVEAAVRIYEEPPADGVEVSTPWGEVWLGGADWAEAFAVGADRPHNEARDEVWAALLDLAAAKSADLGADAEPSVVRRVVAADAELREAFGRAWPMLEPTEVVGDLWAVPAYLRHCAPWLTAAERQVLRRPEPHTWTEPDLPLLDAAWLRVGDPMTVRDRARDRRAAAAERERKQQAVAELIEHDDSEMQVMRMLNVADGQAALAETVDERVDPLAGPFAHVVVDEAQELTDAQWQMLLTRCPTRSFTIVGDRAQARSGFAESWTERLARVGLPQVELASLTINYRTPSEVMTVAEPVIRAALPDANVPTSIRSSGRPVRYAARPELAGIVRDWLARHEEGIGCVIGDPSFPESDRIRSLTPQTAKGLEFDLVVLVEPDGWGDGVAGAVDRYVAMTRATSDLIVLTG